MTASTELKLPIRLVPQKGAQVLALVFFGVFFGFSMVWMAGAAGFFEHGFNWTDLHANWFPLFGLPFAFVGFCGLANAALSLLPNSPYSHLQITSEGIILRSFLKQKRHAWRELPTFDNLEVVKRDDDGTSVSHYTVAMIDALAPDSTHSKGTYRREVVRIDADAYGANKGQADAEALTGWLNKLRSLALEGKLRAGELVEVPENFRATARSVAAAPATGTPQQSQTVVRR